MTNFTADVEPLDRAILKLLSEVPERWDELDSDTLTTVEEEALKLLTGAGLVERKFSIRLSLIGHPVRVEVTATATGEYGLIEAMEPALRKAWNAWADFYREHREGPEEERTRFFCEKTGLEMWRLTGDGVKARHDVQSGNAAMTLDFIRRGTVYAGRPAVRGHGRAERVQETRQADVPSKVEVTNLGELSGPLAEIAATVQNAFEKMAVTRSGQQPDQSKQEDGAETRASADWRDVQTRLLNLYDAGEPFTSQRDLAERLGCSVATINKAVNASARLKGWMDRHSRRSPKAKSLNEMVIDNTASRREADPAVSGLPEDDVDRIMALLIEQAQPEARAHLNELNDEGRRTIVNLYLEQQQDRHNEDDNPRGNRILGRKP